MSVLLENNAQKGKHDVFPVQISAEIIEVNVRTEMLEKEKCIHFSDTIE